MDFSAMVQRVKDVVRQRLLSKTYWVSAALVVLGTIQPYVDLIKPILTATGGKVGIVVAGIGLAMAVLREYTNKALSQK